MGPVEMAPNGEVTHEHTIETRPLKILQLKQGSSEVEILTENLEIISHNLQQCGANLVSIVAVMGTYRTGKSFILDLLLRYLKKKVSDERAMAKKMADALAAAMARAQEEGKEVHPAELAAQVSSSISNSSVPSRAQAWSFGEEQRQKRAVPSWVLEGGNSDRVSEGSKTDDDSLGFAWRPGKDKCTQGIWLWNAPFVFTDSEGRKVGVLLMDTQGAWDDTMTKAQSATIFGITALLSSKLIYNIQNRVEEDKLENLDYITTFATTVCSDLPGRESPFGHLELLVRDWANYEDGFTMEQCQEQMAEHMDDHMSPQKVPADAVPRVERLKSSFRSIRCHGLPHPGLKVTKPLYTGEIDSIDRDFLTLLDNFACDFFSGEFPHPSAPLGMEITVGSFKQIVLNFANVFRENAPDMAIGLREAFVKVELMTCRDDLLKRFRDQLNRQAPDHTVLDPVQLEKVLDRLKSTFREEFITKLRPWRMKESDESAAVAEFTQTVNDAIVIRKVSNEQQVEGATMKLVASPVVGCTAYFLLVHHWLLYIAMSVGAYLHAKKWSAKKDVEIYDPVVVQGMTEDVKKFWTQRWKDLQAIEIAVQRFTPNDAMEAVMKASKQAGAMAAASGLVTPAPAPESQEMRNLRPGAASGSGVLR